MLVLYAERFHFYLDIQLFAFGMWGVFFLQVSHYFLKFVFSAIVTIPTIRIRGFVCMCQIRV